MRSRTVRGVLAIAVIAVVVAGAYLYVNREGGPSRVKGLAPVGDDPFGDGEVLNGASGGIYNDDGTRLAVFTPSGLGVAERGRIRPVTEEGTKVVDAAWFGNGATLLVAEGPLPTGGLAVVDIDGNIRGTVPLNPSIAFGTGHGMAVVDGGRQAVVTAVDRPALGREERRLVVVDLESGATRDLTAPGGADEYRPFYVDAGRVVFTEAATIGGSPRAVVIEVATGAVEELAADAEVVGVVDDGTPVLLHADRSLTAGRHEFGSVPEETELTTIAARRGQGVVVETVTTAEGRIVSRLRLLDLDPVPPG